MEEHCNVGELIAVYRGVPIGRFRVVEVPVEGVSDLSQQERERLGVSDTTLFADGFEPAPAYSTIADVIRLDNLARHKLGFLGPVADPQSDERGRAAMQAAAAVCDEIEFHDLLGLHVGGRVAHIWQDDVAGELRIGLFADFDQDAAGVVARLRDISVRGDGHDAPSA
jgi:hypothetical protein